MQPAPFPDILLSHPDFIAINKPADCSVHSENGIPGLAARLAAHLGIPQTWMLHRLDKPTSGILLFSLNRQAAAQLSEQFARRQMHKTYIALSDRRPAKKQGTIKGGMEKSRRGTWKLTRSTENPAVTQFTSHSLAPKLRLFRLRPLTGKTHQLRVAMKSLGSPILGDTHYGGTPAARMYLHAQRLAFDYKGTHFDIFAAPDESWPEEARTPPPSDGL